MTRCVNGEALFDDTAREFLRRQLWKVADFCGVKVVTYAIMQNHFHVLLLVPEKKPVSDRELLRRYQVLHPNTNPWLTARLDVIADWLTRNTQEGQSWREQQLALMNDLSSFMRLLKQRFSRWFNATHQRFGTLWADRFKSILIEPDHHTLLTIAAYIDLNAVRKGLVQDPKDNRFCGYSEALAGSKPARHGIMIVCPFDSWAKSASTYRSILYSAGASPRADKCQIEHDAFFHVMTQNGQLSLAEILRHRWIHFTEGKVLGSQAFVAEQKARLARTNILAHLPRSMPRPTPADSLRTPWGGWSTLQRINRRFIMRAND